MTAQPARPFIPPTVQRLIERASAALRAGRPAEAIAPLREAARRLPQHAGLWHDLGVACLQTGEVSEAIAALQASIAADPGMADSHLRLAIALEATGATEAALAAYALATALQPGLADAQYRAGALLDSLGRAPEAVAAYRRAAAAAPATTLGRVAAIRAALAEQRHDEAEKLLRVALVLDREHAVLLDLLGNLLADTGRFAEARAVLLRAIAADPMLAGSFYDIARCAPLGPQDARLIGQMRGAAAWQALGPDPRARVLLALGKAADDLGDPAEAMRQFDLAEAQRNLLVRFDAAAFSAEVDRIIAWFSPRRLADAAAAGSDAATPVLIMGLPRSGTTLVEQILSAHPAVAAGGELPFWLARGGAWAAGGGMDRADGPDAAVLAQAAADYLAVLHGVSAQAARVTDKLPLNLLWAGLIHLALPNATIVCCRRAPVDVALSIHMTHFNPLLAFPTGGTALVDYIRACERLAAHWRAVLPATRYLEVDYAALTQDPEPTIRRLVAACGLDWDDACLHPEANRRVVRTPSKWQARQPIHSGAVDRWRRYQPWLGPLAALLDSAPG